MTGGITHYIVKIILDQAEHIIELVSMYYTGWCIQEYLVKIINKRIAIKKIPETGQF